MIYTLTLNPAVDYIMHLRTFLPGETNRTSNEQFYFGGKGINVSRMLHTLGLSSTALGFIAGFTGKALEAALQSEGIITDFIALAQGNTRVNVKLKGERESELNAAGPAVDAAALEALFEKLKGLRDGDTLVLSGSVPASLPEDIYARILNMLSDKKLTVVVDTTGEKLLKTLRFCPFLIKPNKAELAELTGADVTTTTEIIAAAKRLQEMGAQNVLVSLGREGALLLDQDSTVHTHAAPGGKSVNTVGAGDSMVAGFLAGMDRGAEYALHLGSAAGGATACSSDLASAEEIQKLL